MRFFVRLGKGCDVCLRGWMRWISGDFRVWGLCPGTALAGPLSGALRVGVRCTFDIGTGPQKIPRPRLGMKKRRFVAFDGQPDLSRTAGLDGTAKAVPLHLLLLMTLVGLRP